MLERLTNVTRARPAGVDARDGQRGAGGAARAAPAVPDPRPDHRTAAAEQALREADRRKDEFLATLAHELRNPLAPIRTGLQVLTRCAADAPQAARVRAMMERQLEQLVKLIDDLLDVSRIATGKVVLQRERLDLRNVIEAALEGVPAAVVDAGAARRSRATCPTSRCG